MNFWTPTGDNELSAGFDDKTMPWYVLYDYVEVYSWEEATNEFVFKWRDDFHDFNYDRWHKQEGGFEDNSSIFYPENVYTSHGKLVIKMETEEYHDKEQEQFESPEPEFTPYYYQGEYVHEHLAHGGYPDHHPDYPTNSLPQNAYPLLNLKEKSYKKKSKDEEDEDKLREKYLQKLAKLQAEEWEEYDRIHGIDPSVRKRQLEQIEHEHKMQKEMQKKLEKQQKEQGKMIEKEIKEESEEDKKERKHIKKEEKDYSKIAEEEFQDFGGMDYYPRS